MQSLTRLPIILLLLVTAASASRGTAAERGSHRRPRLVVVISIDQFRADYVVRFQDLYLAPGSAREPGGFRFLQELGAFYPDCRYDHYRTVTAAGHAVIGTGAQPAVNGVVGNSWWDRKAAQSVYCVEDPKSRVVGAAPGSRERPMSAANLLTTTVGDELELATGGQARTVSLSLKDRAAILLCGHRADQAVWFDEGTGGWVSSSYYCKDGKLPPWAEQVNARKLPDQMRQQPWVPAVDDRALERVWPLKGGSRRFSHALTGADYVPFTTGPTGNQFVFETARQAVLTEGLGQDEIPDVLTINLASNDYVGHRYGPDSAEVLDLSVQTDRQLAEFHRFLAKTVPGGMASVTLALSSDHGVAVVPELNAQSGVPASRAIASAIRAAAEQALDAAIGPADWIVSVENGEIYLGEAALKQYPAQDRGRLENVAAGAARTVPGVYFAIGKTAVLAGQAPPTRIGPQIARGIHPSRSGDVVVLLDPHWLAGALPIGTGTSHGGPFPYDSHVPLLMAGCGVRKGVYGEPVSPARLAPSLSFLLRVARPSGADEPLLPGLQGLQAPGS